MAKTKEIEKKETPTVSKKEKVAKKKSPAVKKEAVEDSDAPKELRSKRNSGRPSNEERTSNDYLRTNLRLLAADLLADMRKNFRKYGSKDKVSLLGMCLKTLSLSDDAERDEDDLTFEILAKKYLKMKDDARRADEAIKQAMTANPLGTQQQTE